MSFKLRQNFPLKDRVCFNVWSEAVLEKERDSSVTTSSEARVFQCLIRSSFLATVCDSLVVTSAEDKIVSMFDQK